MNKSSCKFISFAGVMLVAMALSMAGETRPVLVVNKGVGGNNTANALSRIERDVLSNRPDCLIVEFGMNDALNSQSLIEPQQYTENIRTIIEKAQAGNIKHVALVTINPVIEKYVRSRHKEYPFPESLAERIEKYNQAIKSLVKEKNLILIDLNELVVKNKGVSENAESLIRNTANSKSADGVHLTADGNKLLAEDAAEKLKSVIKPGNTVVCFGDSITFGANLKGAGTVSGDTYPAHLQLLLNKQLGITAPPASPEPVPVAAISGTPAVNLITNGSFEQSANGVMPDNWVFWKKNNDKCGMVSDGSNAIDGKRFMRISIGDKPDVSAFVRSDIVKTTPGAYRFSCNLRGSGELSMGISAYKTNEGKPVYKLVGNVKLTPEWARVEYPIQIDQGISTFSISFNVNGKADIDNIIMEPSSAKPVEPAITSTTPATVAPPPVANKTPEFKNTVYLNNKSIALQLASPEQGGGILSIKNSAGKEFINKKISGELWRIKFKKIKSDTTGLPAIVNLSIDPEKDDGTNDKSTGLESDELAVNSGNSVVKCQKIEKSGFVKFTWSGMDVGKEEKCLDVWVSFTLDDDSFCRINSGFENRSSEYTVFYFLSPVVEGIGALDNQPQLDYLATPSYNGRLIRDPVSKGLLGKNRIFQPNRSGHSMEFDAYYNSGNGLYLGCFDREQFAKRYQIGADPGKGISWSLVNVPNNMRKVPQKWEVPYPAVLRCFSGDWYDACQIYREWALKQSWSSEGPLLSRKSIPQWFKDIDEWLSINESVLISSRPDFNQMTQDFGKYKLGTMCYGWGKGHHFDEMNPERFPLDKQDLEYLKIMSQNNIAVMGYIQCTGWSDKTESFIKEGGLRSTVKTFSGQSLKWATDVKGNEIIAYPGKAWTKVLGDTVEEMAKAGFAAAYLDSGNHGGTYLNFNPNCSSDSGGGNSYIKGNQQLIQSIKQRARKINPDFCFTAESFWEGNIAELDGILVCNTTNIYLEGNRVTAIPMAQTVYHDYCLMYSVWPSRWDVERDSARGYVAKHGLAFTWGVKPGWNILSLLYKYQNHEIALETSLKRYEAYSKSKKFLVYGQMLRPPEIISANELLPVKWHISYSEKYYDVNMPSVLGTAWRSPDGKLGIVLYNISDKAQKISLKLDCREYSIPKDKNVQFTSLYPEGKTLTADINKDYAVLTAEVPPLSPLVFELE
jgi:lysophospholipase L1-like esterase